MNTTTLHNTPNLDALTDDEFEQYLDPGDPIQARMAVILEDLPCRSELDTSWADPDEIQEQNEQLDALVEAIEAVESFADDIVGLSDEDDNKLYELIRKATSAMNNIAPLGEL